MTDVNFDSALWAQPDSNTAYTGYKLRTDKDFGFRICTLKGNVNVTGGSVPSGNYLYPSRYNLTIKNNVTFTIDGNITVASSGSITNRGTITNNGGITNTGTMTNETEATISNSGTITNNNGASMINIPKPPSPTIKI